SKVMTSRTAAGGSAGAGARASIRARSSSTAWARFGERCKAFSVAAVTRANRSRTFCQSILPVFLLVFMESSPGRSPVLDEFQHGELESRRLGQPLGGLSVGQRNDGVGGTDGTKVAGVAEGPSRPCQVAPALQQRPKGEMGGCQGAVQVDHSPQG